MKMKSAELLLLWGLLSLGFAGMQGYSIPPKLQNFYNTVKTGSCEGGDKLAGGFHDTEDGPKKWSYCQKSVAGKAIFLQGPSTLANMDIDCDGDSSYSSDGRCDNSDDTQDETAFKDEVSKFGIKDLNAYVHPYVVFGNEGSYTPTFDPQQHGVKPLSVMAVVCGTPSKLVYGIWGDTNGDDGPPLVGEASLSLATACFGNGVNGDNGHDETDVLYIAFTGDKAVPGSSANWKAKNFNDFETSIKNLGDKLVAGLFGTSSLRLEEHRNDLAGE